MKGEVKQTIQSENISQIQFSDDYVRDIKLILSESRTYAKQHINYAMIYAYWLTGKRIVFQEQKGLNRAEYGKEIIKNLSTELTNEFGKGFSTQSLYNFRLFYEKFSEPEKFSAVWRILTWSHYKLIMRVTQKEIFNETHSQSDGEN